MFPLQRSDELAFHNILSSNPHHIPCQQNMISQDLIWDYNFSFDSMSDSCPFNYLETYNHCNVYNNNTKSSSRKRKQSGGGRGTLSAAADAHKGGGHDITATENHRKLKKILHCDTERHRRREMSTLCASLRSLLPPEYVKRKRSISDLMGEGVSYIKEMHTNLKDLERRRESISHAASSSLVSLNTATSTSPAFVSVSSRRDGGLEILVDTGLCFPLSTLLRALLNKGVDVVSCVSTKTTHGRLLHALHSQVCGEICVDLEALQQKLSAVINPPGLHFRD